MRKLQMFLCFFLMSMGVSSIYPMNYNRPMYYNDQNFPNEMAEIDQMAKNDRAAYQADKGRKTLLKAALVGVGLFIFFYWCGKQADCVGGAARIRECLGGDERSCAVFKVCSVLCQKDPDLIKDTQCFTAKVLSIIAPKYMNEHMDKIIDNSMKEGLKEGLLRGVEEFKALAIGGINEIADGIDRLFSRFFE